MRLPVTRTAFSKVPPGVKVESRGTSGLSADAEFDFTVTQTQRLASHIVAESRFLGRGASIGHCLLERKRFGPGTRGGVGRGSQFGPHELHPRHVEREGSHDHHQRERDGDQNQHRALAVLRASWETT